MGYLTREESDNLRERFRSDCGEALDALQASGLTREIPVMSVFCALVDKRNGQELPWFNLDDFMSDARAVLNRFVFWSGSGRSQAIDLLDKHLSGNYGYRKISTWNWATEKKSFDKSKLIRDTDSLIRDLVKAIGNDNTRLTDTILLASIVGKLQVGEDSNIWKEAAKLYTKQSFVEFFCDLLNHSGRVNNAAYTQSEDLIKLFDWECQQHPVLHGGKIKWGSQTLSW